METTAVRVVAVRPVGPDAVTLELETPQGFDARPGQFVKVSADLDGERESRFYTISSPDVDETLELTVGVDPEGTLGPWLADCDPGETVTLSGPFGNDYYEGESRVLVVAGGPGVGPAVGIAEAARRDDHAAAVVYRDDAVIHEDRLSALADAGVRVDVVSADDDVEAAVGDALDVLGDPATVQVFVYGFADFLDVAMDALDAAGAETETAKVENFG